MASRNLWAAMKEALHDETAATNLVLNMKTTTGSARPKKIGKNKNTILTLLDSLNSKPKFTKMVEYSVECLKNLAIDEISAEELVSEGIVEALGRIMSLNPFNARIQEACNQCLLAIVKTASIAEIVGKKLGPKPFQHALEKHTSVLVLTSTCALGSRLCKAESNIDLLVGAGVLAQLDGVMRRNVDSVELMSAGTAFLRRVAVRGECAIAVLDTGCFGRVLAGVKIFPHTAQLVRHALQLASVICQSGPSLVEKIKHMKALDILINALEQNPEDLALVKEGTLCVSLLSGVEDLTALVGVEPGNNLATANGLTKISAMTLVGENVEHLLRMGGLNWILEALRIATGNTEASSTEEILTSGSRALKRVCSNQEGTQTATKGGAVPLLLDILRKHLQEAPPACEALGALGKLCNLRENCAVIEKAGAVELTLELVKEHPGSDRVQRAVLEFLTALLAADQHILPLLLKAGIVEMVAQILGGGGHLDSQMAIQTMEFVTSLCHISPDIPVHFGQVGLDAVVKSLKAHTSEPPVVIVSLRLLRLLAKHAPTAENLHKSLSAADVLEVLNTHSENVTVQEEGAAVLSLLGGVKVSDAVAVLHQDAGKVKQVQGNEDPAFSKQLQLAVNTTSAMTLGAETMGEVVEVGGIAAFAEALEAAKAMPKSEIRDGILATCVEALGRLASLQNGATAILESGLVSKCLELSAVEVDNDRLAIAALQVAEKVARDQESAKKLLVKGVVAQVALASGTHDEDSVVAAGIHALRGLASDGGNAELFSQPKVPQLCSDALYCLNESAVTDSLQLMTDLLPSITSDIVKSLTAASIVGGLVAAVNRHTQSETVTKKFIELGPNALFLNPVIAPALVDKGVVVALLKLLKAHPQNEFVVKGCLRTLVSLSLDEISKQAIAAADGVTVLDSVASTWTDANIRASVKQVLFAVRGPSQEELAQLAEEKRKKEDETRHQEAEARRAAEQQRAADEAARLAEASRLLAEEEARRAHEERKRISDEQARVEQQRREAEEERQRLEAERERLHAEQLRLEEEEKARKTEEAQVQELEAQEKAEKLAKFEEERAKAEAEMKQVEQEKLRIEKARARAAEEQRRREEEDVARQEHEKQRVEQEAKELAEERARIEEARLKAAEEAKLEQLLYTAETSALDNSRAVLIGSKLKLHRELSDANAARLLNNTLTLVSPSHSAAIPHKSNKAVLIDNGGIALAAKLAHDSRSSIVVDAAATLWSSLVEDHPDSLISGGLTGFVEIFLGQDEANVFHVNATLRARALTDLSKSKLDKNFTETMTKQGIERLVLCLHDPNIEVAVAAARVLAKLSGDQPALALLTDCLKFDDLIQTIQTDIDNPEYVRSMAFLLGSLATAGSATQLTIGEKGGLNVLTKCLEKHCSNPGVVKHIFDALGALTLKCPQNTHLLTEIRPFALMTDVTRTHLADDELVENSLRVFLNCIADKTGRVYVVEDGAAALLSDVVINHLSNRRLLLTCCRTQTALSAVKVNTKPLIEQGTAQSLVAVMNLFDNDERLVHEALKALMLLSSDTTQELQEKLAEAGVPEIAVQSLETLGPKSHTVTTQALGVLLNTSCIPSTSDVVMRSHGIRLALKAIEVHGTDQQAVETALYVMSLVSARAKLLDYKMKPHHAELLLRAMTQYGPNSKVAAKSCLQSLQHLCWNERLAKMFQSRSTTSMVLRHLPAIQNGTGPLPYVAFDTLSELARNEQAALEMIEPVTELFTAMATNEVGLEKPEKFYASGLRLLGDMTYYALSAEKLPALEPRVHLVKTVNDIILHNENDENVLLLALTAYENMAIGSRELKNMLKAENVEQLCESLEARSTFPAVREACHRVRDCLHKLDIIAYRKIVFEPDEEEQTLDMTRDIRNFLIAGTMVKMWTEYGFHKARHLRVTTDLKTLMWLKHSDKDHPPRERKTHVYQFRSIERGLATAKLRVRRFGQNLVDESKAFSISIRGGTLDFSTETHGLRERWVYALECLLMYTRSIQMGEPEDE